MSKDEKKKEEMTGDEVVDKTNELLQKYKKGEIEEFNITAHRIK